MTCRGTCSRNHHKGDYKDGARWCTECETYVDVNTLWKGVRCSCCHYVVRAKPRDALLKVKMEKALAAE